MKLRWSPAKVNLTLKVGAKLPSGFHEIETAMLPIGLYDRVGAVRCQDGVEIHVGQRMTGTCTSDHVSLIPTDENNLVVKIARGFLRHFALDGGVRFYLYKRIPAGGGLGGASSNAAAALLLLNDLFATRQSWQELARFSEAYGSDIAYFLQSCAAICRGRGEVVEPIAAPNALCLVIVRPPFGLSTADVFQRLAQQRRDDSGGYSVARAHTETRQMAQCLREGRTREIAGSLSNDLQPAAIRLRPELTQVQQVMDRTYPLASQMSGSGSCWFACYPHRRRALWASHRLRASGIGTVDIARPISTPLPPTSPP